MRKIFYTNQTLKYRNGLFTGNIDDGERKIIINFSEDESRGSLFVYNLYTRPHDVIRGIKQGMVTRLSENELILQGYGNSSNGVPIDDLSAKVTFDETEKITSIEFIKSSADIALLHKNRIDKCSPIFFELFKLQDILNFPNFLPAPVEYISYLNEILDILPKDIQKIKYNEDRLEFSLAGEFLSFIATNPTLMKEQKVYYKTCLTGFYMLYKSVEGYNNDHERLKLIELVHQNNSVFLAMIIYQLLRSEKFEKDLPFKELPELDRAGYIYMLMDCYLLYLADQNKIHVKWYSAIEDSRKILESNKLEPYNLENSQTDIINIYYKLFQSIEESITNLSCN